MRFPHWVGLSAGNEALPEDIRGFLDTASYVETSFDWIDVDFQTDSFRFQNLWKFMKGWIADAEWKTSSTLPLVQQCLRFKVNDADINSGIVSSREMLLQKRRSIDLLIEAFKVQLKALKNAIEVQIFEAKEHEMSLY